MRRFQPLLRAFAALAFGGILQLCALAQTAPSAGGVAATGPQFRVVRSVSGSQGSEQGGRFIVEDPRSVFYLPADTKVLVYFEWEGPLGNHHFEAIWKNPEGRPVAMSDFRYEAKERRFAGYWTLLLTETTAPGTWTMEARIDGEAAGSHSFQVVAAVRPEAQGPVRRMLTPAELYQRALASTVTIDKLNAAGERVGSGLGFYIGDGRILTLFQVIDGAGALRIQRPDGTQAEVAAVLGYHRWQDWAVLKTAADLPALTVAPERSWAVGDRCYTLAIEQTARVLADAVIRGVSSDPRVGERLNLSFGSPANSAGAPLLNDYGEAVGIVGAAQMPGMPSLMGTELVYPGNLAQAGMWRGSNLALPIETVQLSVQNDFTLEGLARAGEFVPPLVPPNHVARGTVSRLLERRSGGYVEAIDEKFEYTAADQKAHVLIMWQAKEKVRTQLLFRVYDVQTNRLLAQSKPRRIALNPRDNPKFTTWELPLAAFPAGDYRVDVILEPNPVWRTFFRVKK